MSKKKIYFSASVYGGRELLNDYKKLIKSLKEHGEVLTEELGDINLIKKEENIIPKQIYETDVTKINNADIVFAELTIPSLGVGYELGYAEAHNKKIVGIYNQTIKEKITPMITGNSNITIIGYKNIDEIIKKIESLI